VTHGAVCSTLERDGVKVRREIPGLGAERTDAVLRRPMSWSLVSVQIRHGHGLTGCSVTGMLVDRLGV